MNNNTNKTDYKLGAVFGAGRSGTTWLGSILSSHPEVSYRFEPFHRLQRKNAEISKSIESIRSCNFSNKDLSYLYKTLLPAYPECEKPPFFYKKDCFNFGKKLIWPLSRKNSFCADIFTSIYTPKKQPMLIFKEVALVDLLIKLLEVGIPIVYIVRHPCAVVSSVMEGQKKMLMPDKRRSVLDSLLYKHQPELWKQYKDRINELEVCEQQALLWLIDVETALNACRNTSNSFVVLYEKLAKQPLEVSKKIFNHFRLEMTPQSITFIEESTKNSSTSRIKTGEVGINSYFTVFRDSNFSCDRWKQEMPFEEQAKVLKIVEGSNAFSLYAKDDL